MSIENLSSEEQHKIVIKTIQTLYPNYFRVQKKLVFSNEVHKKLTLADVNKLAVVSSRIFNMTGGSVGDINLYKLFQAYFLDLEKRKEINEIID